MFSTLKNYFDRQNMLKSASVNLTTSWPIDMADENEGKINVIYSYFVYVNVKTYITL